jgi:hypothetical protein
LTCRSLAPPVPRCAADHRGRIAAGEAAGDV